MFRAARTVDAVVQDVFCFLNAVFIKKYKRLLYGNGRWAWLSSLICAEKEIAFFGRDTTPKAKDKNWSVKTSDYETPRHFFSA